MRRAVALALALAALATLLPASPGAPAASATPSVHPLGRPLLVNVTAEAGLAGWIHAGFIGSETEGTNFPEAAGPGACWLDFDADGRLDVFLVNGLWVTHAWKNAERDPRSALFRNLGNGAFADVAPAAGVALSGLYMGCSAADYDDDGDADLLAQGFGVLALLRNEGGAFVNVTAAAGLAGLDCHPEFPCFATSSTWLDYDRDGCLDVWINMYADWNLSNPPEAIGGDPQKAFLMRSRCDGTFEDRTAFAGVAHEHAHWSSVSAHLNDDLWPDLYVSNDGDENDLYLNNGNGTFRRPMSSADNGARNGMGTDVGDFSGDLRMDLVTTNFVSQTNGIFRSRPDGEYDDVGVEAPFDDAEPYSGWAARFYDLQNDGRPDLMIVNGMTEQVLRDPPEQPMLAYEQLPDRSWASVRGALGAAFEEDLVARGAAWADYDDDGDLDVVVLEAGENPAHLYRSDRTPGNFLNVALVGDALTGTRDAIGARVTVASEGVPVQVQDRAAGGAFLGSNDPRLHFGLARAESATVTVRWPDGATQSFAGVRANSFLRIEQGAAAPETLRALPIVATAAAPDARRLAPIDFRATAAPGDAPVVALGWDFGDGATSGSPEALHAYADVGVFHARATARDALGREKTQSHAVRVWDELSADVEWASSLFLPHEPAAGVARVRFSHGDPVAGADVSLEIRYTSGSGDADAAAARLPRFVQSAAGYVTRWMNGTTDATGGFAFTAPWSHESPTPGVPASANAPGRYLVTVTGGARGSAITPLDTEYRVLVPHVG